MATFTASRGYVFGSVIFRSVSSTSGSDFTRWLRALYLSTYPPTEFELCNLQALYSFSPMLSTMDRRQAEPDGLTSKNVSYNGVPPPSSLKVPGYTARRRRGKGHYSQPLSSSKRLRNTLEAATNSIQSAVDTHAEDQSQTPQSLEPFQFSSLPHELQLEVFHLLLSRIPSLDYSERKLLSDATTSLLILSKAHYRLFAPSFYQSTLIKFRKPLVFARLFLYVCSDLCLANLRHLECHYGSPFGGSTQTTAQDVIYNTRKLTDLFYLYRDELKTLDEFKLVYEVEYDYNCGKTDLQDLRTGKSIPWQDKDRLWARFDEMRMRVFSKFQRRMSRSTFKAFDATRDLVVYTWTTRTTQHCLKELNLTFRRRGRGS